jgi:hypothetical protein
LGIQKGGTDRPPGLKTLVLLLTNVQLDHPNSANAAIKKKVLIEETYFYYCRKINFHINHANAYIK